MNLQPGKIEPMPMILVVTGSYNEYMRFLSENRLNQKQARYAYLPEHFRGFSQARILLYGDYRNNPMYQEGYDELSVLFWRFNGISLSDWRQQCHSYPAFGKTSGYYDSITQKIICSECKAENIENFMTSKRDNRIICRPCFDGRAEKRLAKEVTV